MQLKARKDSEQQKALAKEIMNDYEEITDAELQADSDLMETLAVSFIKDDSGNENVNILFSEDYMNY